MAPNHKTLRNPPITEALIDIKVQHKPDTDLSTLLNLHALIGNDYPDMKKRYVIESGFSFDGEEGGIVSQVNRHEIIGYQFSSSDEKQVVQYRMDGFTFSRLHPYENWESLRKEAERLWTIFIDSLQPFQVTRAAVRYINRIDIPSTNGDWGKYFSISPQLPGGLSYEVESFLSKVEFTIPESGAKGIVSMAPTTPTSPNSRSIIFDIDIFSEQIFKVDDSAMWKYICQLRDIKNNIFFESITHRTKELFQ